MSTTSKPDEPSFATEMAAQITPGPDRIVRREWTGGISEVMATLPQVRLGKRWFSTKLLLVAGGAIRIAWLLAGILGARYLRTFPEVQAFVAKCPGTGAFGPPVHTGFPWWLRNQHDFNLVFMPFIIRPGLQILADRPRLTLDAGCLPETEWLRLRGAVPNDNWTAKDDSVGLPRWLGLPEIRHSIGLARMVALQPGPSLGSDRSR